MNLLNKKISAALTKSLLILSFSICSAYLSAQPQGGPPPGGPGGPPAGQPGDPCMPPPGGPNGGPPPGGPNGGPPPGGPNGGPPPGGPNGGPPLGGPNGGPPPGGMDMANIPPECIPSGGFPEEEPSEAEKQAILATLPPHCAEMLNEMDD